MESKQDDKKPKTGIAALYAAWTWKDFLLVVNTTCMFLLMLVFLTDPPKSIANEATTVDASGIKSALSEVAPATTSVSSEPHVCPSGGWLAPSTTGAADPWYEMKITLRPARCHVKGKWVIEELDPEHNFRRMWALGFTGDVEEKYEVLPYMLATQDDTLVTRPRRVFIDFGANRFDTSVYWMARNYPVDFTEIWAFEVTQDLFVIPRVSDQTPTPIHQMDSQSKMVSTGRGPQDIPAWFLERINFRQQYVTGEDNPSQGRISATRFIKEELKLTKDDTVVIKMDIEGSEWDILPQWIADPDMVDIVDELFVEIHYKDETMNNFGWMQFPHTKDEATNLLIQMREKGFYAHTWP